MPSLNMITYASNPDDTLVKSDLLGESTEHTASSSNSESACDEAASVYLRDWKQQSLPKSVSFSSVHTRPKSVSFSSVHTREYNVVEEFFAVESDEDGTVSSCNRGWDYTEKKSDLETHMDETQREKREKGLNILLDQIDRVDRENRERDQKKKSAKKNGFRSRVLKPIWKSVLNGARLSRVD